MPQVGKRERERERERQTERERETERERDICCIELMHGRMF